MKPSDLIKWRKEHGYTQTEFGKKLGVTKTTIYRWEAGYRHIPSFLHLTLECMDKKGVTKVKGKKTQKKVR